MKEEKFLNLIHELIPQSVKYLGDDTAYIAEKDLIVTQDTLIEDVHFRQTSISPFYLGRKSVAVNLSDIAASGGIPKYILISLSMPGNIDETFIKEFYKGVDSICGEYGVFVVGGDLTAADKITVSICALASGEGLNPANRRNAAQGDIVAVTGNFGSSSAGLHVLETSENLSKNNNFNDLNTKFINAHINPVPRVNEGREILKAAKTPAMMDSSDGLVDALYKICVMSEVSMEIEFDEIPFDPDIYNIFKDKEEVQKAILFGGEDFELVSTMPDEVYQELKTLIPLYKIGIVKKADKDPCPYIKFKAGKVIKADNEFLETGLYKHFD